MQPQQMAMEIQVLRQENLQFAKVIKMQKSQIEEMQASLNASHSFENNLNALLTGYCAQPRAASDPFWMKDDASGTLIPAEGGPRWAVGMALQALEVVLSAYKGQSNTPAEPNSSQEQPSSATVSSEEAS